MLKARFWAVRETVAAPPAGEAVGEGETDAEGETVGEADGEGETVGDADGEGEAAGDGLGVAEGDGDGEGAGAGAGVGVATALPSLKAISLGVPNWFPMELAAAQGQTIVSPATAGQPLIPALTF